MSLETASEAVPLSHNYLACIENGRQNMSLGKILELSTALNINIEKLLKFSED